MSNTPDDDIATIIGVFAAAGVLALLILSAIVAIPIIAAGVGGYVAYRWWHNDPTRLEKRERRLLDQLYEDAKRIRPDTLSQHDFCVAVLDRLPPRPKELTRAIVLAALELYDAEHFGGDIPPPPPVAKSLEGARWKDALSAHIAKVAHIASSKNAAEIIAVACHCFLGHTGALNEDDDEEEALFQVPIAHYLDDLNETVEDLVVAFFGDVVDTGLFKELREQLERNIFEASGVPFTRENRQSPKVLLPTQYKGDNVAYAYLKNTPLLPLLDAHVPFSFDEDIFFEHAYCLAPPGTGKTQLIQFLVSHFLPKVANDEASCIVLDSQGDLINRIRKLALFAPGGELEDKLIVLEPSLTHPPAVNIFDFGGDRMNRYSPDDREKFTNIAIGQMTYVLDALMGGEGGGTGMTPKQEVLFRHVCRMLTEMDATLATFREILEIKKPADLVPYGRYLENLPKPVQEFFTDQFFESEFAGTRRQVAWRISKLRENTYFDRMFSHPKSKLDLFTELNSSKVILINTDKERLGEDGTNVFGRFFISQLLTASQERASLPRSQRRDVFCFIDEAQDYISTDAKISTLLDQARKMRIGLFLAHQRTRQIKNANVLDALVNTAIKFASTDNPQDADLMARAMQTDRQFIAKQPKQHFALSVRRVTPSALSVRVPFFVMEKMDTMSDEDEKTITAKMHERYSSPVTGPEREDVEDTDTRKPEVVDDPDNPSTDAV